MWNWDTVLVYSAQRLVPGAFGMLCSSVLLYSIFIYISFSFSYYNFCWEKETNVYAFWTMSCWCFYFPKTEWEMKNPIQSWSQKPRDWFKEHYGVTFWKLTKCSLKPQRLGVLIILFKLERSVTPKYNPLLSHVTFLSTDFAFFFCHTGIFSSLWSLRPWWLTATVAVGLDMII